MANALQTRNFGALFKMMDANRDGVIDWNDYELMLDRFSTLFSLPPSSEGYLALKQLMESDFQALLTNADKNLDGTVDPKEFLDYHDKMVATEEGYRIAVQSFADLIIGFGDADQDGFLSKDDYAIMLRALNVDNASAGQAFAKLDANGDGKISAQELTTAIGQYMRSSNVDDPGHWLFGAPA